MQAETDTLPTDFDIEPEVETKPTPSRRSKATRTSETAKDADGVPYCKRHHCRMKRVSGGRKGGSTVYYKCPVPGCDCRAQMIKTKRESVVPPQPVACPRCSTNDKPVICERSEQHSRASSVVLQCPSCGWKTNAMAVPSLAAQHFAMQDEKRRRKHAKEEIGQR